MCICILTGRQFKGTSEKTQRRWDNKMQPLKLLDPWKHKLNRSQRKADNALPFENSCVKLYRSIVAVFCDFRSPLKCPGDTLSLFYNWVANVRNLMSSCPGFDEQVSEFWWANVQILMSRCPKKVMGRCPMSKCYTTYSPALQSWVSNEPTWIF